MKTVVRLLLLVTLLPTVYAETLREAELQVTPEGVSCELKLQPEQAQFRLRVKLSWQVSREDGSYRTVRESNFVYFAPFLSEQITLRDLNQELDSEDLRVLVYLQLDKNQARLIKTLEL